MYEAPHIDKDKLWRMSYEEFNKWRIENDFPRILKFFQDRLAGFGEWQKEYGFSDKDIINDGLTHLFKLKQLNIL